MTSLTDAEIDAIALKCGDFDPVYFRVMAREVEKFILGGIQASPIPGPRKDWYWRLLLTKLPQLDPRWSEALQAKWFTCFRSMQDMADEIDRAGDENEPDYKNFASSIDLASALDATPEAAQAFAVGVSRALGEGLALATPELGEDK